jgi:RNA polymerase sigma factor (sigma-70 family)
MTKVICIDAHGYRARTLAARDALVVEHVWLVGPIARSVALGLPRSFDVDDLEAEGFMGLLSAATRYRPGVHAGTPFSAFARSRIRGAMLDSVRRRHWEESTRPPIPRKMQVAYIDDFRERLDDGMLRKRLRSAIERLTARQRAVLGAYYAENCESFASAGELLGLSEADVTREHDAVIAILRERLAA